MGRTPPLIAIVGKSGSGKTTLVEKLVAHLSHSGYRVGTIKHSCHPHPMDMPGKDSWRHKQAGAKKAVFAGPSSVQLVMDADGLTEPEAIASQFMSDMDIVIVEGFKQTAVRKIAVIRTPFSEQELTVADRGLVAIATDATDDRRLKSIGVPLLDLNDHETLASFILKHLSVRV